MAFCTTEMGIYIHLNHKVCSCFYSVFKSSDLRILRWRWNAPLHCHWPTNRLVGSHLNDKAPKYLPHSCWSLCFFYGFCCSWHLNATSGKSSGASPVASSILSCCDGNSPQEGRSSPAMSIWSDRRASKNKTKPMPRGEGQGIEYSTQINNSSMDVLLHCWPDFHQISKPWWHNLRQLLWSFSWPGME